MPLSSKTVTYLGGPQVFSIAFALGVLETAHLSVQVVGDVDGFGDPIEYAFNYDPNTGDVTVTDLLSINDVVFIQRLTPIDALLVDFEEGADVSRRNVSRAIKQAIMIAQEVVDDREADSETVAELDAAFTLLQNGIAADVAAADLSASIASAAAAASAASAAEAADRENSMLDDAGNWLTATAYTPGQIYTFSGSAYITLVAHTSTTVVADLGANKVRVFVSKGDSGPGSGDMLKTENLSGLANYTTARANLGLGALAVKSLAALADLDPAAVITDLETLAANKVATAIPVAKAVTDYVDPKVDWVLHASGTLSGAGPTITGLGSFGKVMVVTIGASLTSAGLQQVRVGHSGGLLSTAIYHEPTAAFNEAYLSGTVATPRSHSLIIERFNKTDPIKPCSGSLSSSANPIVAIATALALDRVQIFSNGPTYVSGNYYVFGQQ